MFGVDSGSTCTFGEGAPSAGNAGMLAVAWEGSSIVLCVGDGATGLVTRHNIETGAVETTDVTCSHVLDTDGDLLVLQHLDSADRYDNFEALLAGEEPEHLSLSVFDTRMGADADQLYTAWHSTSEINRMDIETGNDLAPVMLEDHDDWVYGVDRIGQELLVATRDGLKKFDVDSGAVIAVFPELEWLRFGLGFSCRDSAAPE